MAQENPGSKKTDEKDVNIQDLPPKKVTPEDEQAVTGGMASGGRTLATETNINFEASTDGKPPTSNG